VTDLTIAVFDFDGTLVDSDEALIAPFLALGIERSQVRLGRLLADECADLGVTVEQYLDLYDPTTSSPFPGVDELVRSLDRWGVCSNKHPESGVSELDRLGWQPTAFSWALADGKSLVPLLAELDIPGDQVLFVGDTDHDRRCAAEVGATFALAGWNRRAEPVDGDLVLSEPAEVLDHLA
jgi:phosphoglycolate phosphatase-like HAD superfamily hydrolase